MSDLDWDIYTWRFGWVYRMAMETRKCKGHGEAFSKNIEAFIRFALIT